MSKVRARQMRRRMPPGEARLWNLLRAEPFTDFHFRRQVNFEPYYTDFTSHRAKLIVEVDGSQHSEDAALVYDARRSAYLVDRGYRVLRLANFDVQRNIAGVLTMIADAVGLDTN